MPTENNADPKREIKLADVSQALSLLFIFLTGLAYAMGAIAIATQRSYLGLNLLREPTIENCLYMGGAVLTKLAFMVVYNFLEIAPFLVVVVALLVSAAFWLWERGRFLRSRAAIAWVRASYDVSIVVYCTLFVIGMIVFQFESGMVAAQYLSLIVSVIIAAAVWKQRNVAVLIVCAAIGLWQCRNFARANAISDSLKSEYSVVTLQSTSIIPDSEGQTSTQNAPREFMVLGSDEDRIALLMKSDKQLNTLPVVYIARSEVKTLFVRRKTLLSEFAPGWKPKL